MKQVLLTGAALLMTTAAFAATPPDSRSPAAMGATPAPVTQPSDTTAARMPAADPSTKRAAVMESADTTGMFANVPAGESLSSKVVGLNVYNNANQNIGKIKDIAFDASGVKAYIVAVGGFLGIGSKMVEVPFDKLHFGNSSDDNHVVMPGMTKDALIAMPDYHYADRG